MLLLITLELLDVKCIEGEIFFWTTLVLRHIQSKIYMGVAVVIYSTQRNLLVTND